MSKSKTLQHVLLLGESYYNQLVNHKCDSMTGSIATSNIDHLPIDQLQKVQAKELEEERALFNRENNVELVKEKRIEDQQKLLSSAMVKTIIDKFPIYLRTIGHSILQKLVGEQVTWDSQGQIKLASDDESISNSNIIDLIHFAAKLKSSKTSNSNLIPPVGWDKIKSILTLEPTPAADVVVELPTTTSVKRKRIAVRTGKTPQLVVKKRKRVVPSRIEIPQDYDSL